MAPIPSDSPDHWFHRDELPRILGTFAAGGTVVADPAGWGFRLTDDRGLWRLVEVPRSLPRPENGMDVTTWLATLDPSSRIEMVVLVQAGATAAGIWDGERLVRHKVIRKYVVRGRGRAQPAHLRTRGKSRYGSRLRLQNHRAWLEQTSELLLAWWSADPHPGSIFMSCPVRLRAELAAIGLPFDLRSDVHWIPIDVRRPNMKELERIRFRLVHGAVRVTPSFPVLRSPPGAPRRRDRPRSPG